jgi:hypothetical protein
MNVSDDFDFENGSEDESELFTESVPLYKLLDWQVRCQDYVRKWWECADAFLLISPQEMGDRLRDLMEERYNLIRNRPQGISLKLAESALSLVRQFILYNFQF